MGASSISSSPPDDPPVDELIGEARRLVSAADERGLIVRLVGGAAVYLRTLPDGPLLPRRINDIDLVTKIGARTAVTAFLKEAGYVPDLMFNALHGARRLLFYDEARGRKVDVFVGVFAMCHEIPIANRLERETLTVPLAELLMTKLQIVKLTDRDQRDIYNLLYRHELATDDSGAIETDVVGDLCARDWGLWRTVKATIESCKTNLGRYGLEVAAVNRIAERLDLLTQALDARPKTTRWKLRNRIGDRLPWYAEPEELTEAN
jgi:hypothetical protein